MRAPVLVVLAFCLASGGLLNTRLVAAKGSRLWKGYPPALEVGTAVIDAESDMGVQHLKIPGTVQGQGVLLTMFAKCRCDGESCALRAALMFEAVDQPVAEGAMLKTHITHASAVLAGTTPEVQLHSLSHASTVHPLQLHEGWYGQAAMLSAFEEFVVDEGSTGYFDVRITGWERHAVLCCQPECSEPPPYMPQGGPEARGPGEPPPAYVVVTPFYGQPPGVAAALIATHARYHSQLGFNATLLYARHPELLPLRFDAATAPLLVAASTKDGGGLGASPLVLVGWGAGGGNGMPLIDGLAYGDQVVVVEHALVAHWGQGAYLALVDADEFIATPRPTSLQQLLAGDCFQGAAMAHLVYYIVKCEACAENGDPELLLWTNASTALNHRDQQQQGHEGRQHPLASYTLRSKEDHFGRMTGKSIVAADYAYGNFVHQTLVRPVPEGMVSRMDVDPERCAFVAHASDRFSPRSEGPEAFRQDDSWLWFLEAEAEEEKPQHVGEGQQLPATQQRQGRNERRRAVRIQRGM